MKARLLHSLHILLSKNVIGSKQYKSRYIGFRSELQTLRHLRDTGVNVFEGAYLIPLRNGKELFETESILFSVVSDDDLTQYKSIFHRLARIGSKKLYLVSLTNEPEEWDFANVLGFDDKLLIPSCRLFEYNTESSTFDLVGMDLFEIPANFETVPRRSPIEQINAELEESFKEQLSSYSIDELRVLYTERFIFDGLIGFGKERGIPTDIDGIILSDDEFVLLEIKEKDLSKRPPIGFGMDVRRIKQLKRICRRTSLRLQLIVRQVRDQASREFIQYQSIDFQEFYKRTSGTEEIEGGHGMRSESSSNPTQICPIEFFEPIN